MQLAARTAADAAFADLSGGLALVVRVGAAVRHIPARNDV